ncbi:MAG: DegV family protein, partial [Thermomicrobium sp.]|nr:DegV family protein [Thermomicrobium sp.]
AVEAMLRRMDRDVGGRPVHVAVLEAGAAEEAETLARRIAARFHVVEQYVTPFTPAMALYTGPGLLGIAYYTDDTASSPGG